jgi:ribosomal protein uS17
MTKIEGYWKRQNACIQHRILENLNEKTIHACSRTHERFLGFVSLIFDFIDHKCPFTGTVSIRGRVLTGKVVSTKMHRTLVIRREYLHYVPKYNRYERRHKNLSAHVSPAFRVEEGDTVTVGQCRPLSKTVR